MSPCPYGIHASHPVYVSDLVVVFSLVPYLQNCRAIAPCLLHMVCLPQGGDGPLPPLPGTAWCLPHPRLPMEGLPTPPITCHHGRGTGGQITCALDSCQFSHAVLCVPFVAYSSAPPMTPTYVPAYPLGYAPGLSWGGDLCACSLCPTYMCGGAYIACHDLPSLTHSSCPRRLLPSPTCPCLPHHLPTYTHLPCPCPLPFLHRPLIMCIYYLPHTFGSHAARITHIFRL